jgi:hypothetical protein
MAKDTNLPPFISSQSEVFGKSMFPGGYGDSLMSMYRLNVELITTSQKIAMETAQTLMALNQQYQKRVYDQMNELIKSNISKGPFEEKTTSQANVAKNAVEMMSEHAHEISSLLVDSNKKLSENLHKSLKEGLEESKNAARKTTE